MKEAEKQFTIYTEPYREYGPMIDLKINHTKRVTDICVELAKDLKLSKKGTNTAFLCGLLHDIGRFEQWKNYQTYSDAKSIDHGNLGYKILKEKDYLSVYTKDENEKNNILKAVKYHNKLTIPKNLTKEEKEFCKIARDADKLDILYLLSINALDFHSDKSKISKNAWNIFMNKECIKKDEVETKADRLVIFLAFPFDMNYSYSFKVLKEKNYMNTILDNIEKEASKELKEQIKEIRPIVNQYIEEMIVC